MEYNQETAVKLAHDMAKRLASKVDTQVFEHWFNVMSQVDENGITNEERFTKAIEALQSEKGGE